LQQSGQVFTFIRKMPSGCLPNAAALEEAMKGMNLGAHIPTIKQVFSRGNEGHNLVEENRSILDQTDTPHFLFSLSAAILSLLLFILFLAERL
jgi:hypothetical protein